MTLSHAAQSGRHALKERGLDLYETPPCATEALLRVEQLPHWVWEPAAGRGAIVNVLRDHGHAAIASDVSTTDSRCTSSRDFLTQTKAPVGVECIITNPPFQIVNDFVAHALDLCPRVIMLARLAFLESRAPHRAFSNSRGLARVHVFRNRLPMMHRDGWNGPARFKRGGLRLVLLGSRSSRPDDDRSNLLGGAIDESIAPSPIYSASR